MRRTISNLAVGVSVLLCVTTAALWVRSYWHADVLGATRREAADHWQRRGNLFSAGGSLNLNWSRRQNGGGASAVAGWAMESWPLRDAVRARSWHGFGYEATSFDHSPVASDGRAMPVRMTHSHRVTVPHWFVVMLTAPLVVLGGRREARRWRTRRRLRRSLCPTCGYDLRATPGAARSAGWGGNKLGQADKST